MVNWKRSWPCGVSLGRISATYSAATSDVVFQKTSEKRQATDNRKARKTTAMEPVRHFWSLDSHTRSRRTACDRRAAVSRGKLVTMISHSKGGVRRSSTGKGYSQSLS